MTNVILMMKVTTVCAPVNIAVVKYWGKRDEDLILPLNGSISLTLDPDVMCSKTSVATSASFTCDQIWLNGIECPLSSRLKRVLEEIRKRASSCNSSIPEDWKVHICSVNNFPTAAGLASSAAGLACLAFGLAKLYDIKGDISDIARLGSGSACRSMFGGFVEWKVGTDDDGSDSVAAEIAGVDHWPNMAVLILVVNAGKKHTSSTSGMNTSVKTSQLLKHRAEIVCQTIEDMKEAILEKDFQRFAELTMKDSNQMHACCLDTYPPIMYLTDTSRSIIRLVHDINNYFGCNKVSYTFDAGPNACLYLLEDCVTLVLSVIRHFFPPDNDEGFVQGKLVNMTSKIDQDLLSHITIDVNRNALSHIISTKIGDGPKELTSESSLLDLTTGLPLLKN